MPEVAQRPKRQSPDSPSLAAPSDIPNLAARRRRGALPDPEFAAAYFLYWQVARAGDAGVARKHKQDPRPDVRAWMAQLREAEEGRWSEWLAQWFARYQFVGVSARASTALLRWLQRAWPLRLREDVPDPVEILRLQARGERAVTVLTEWPRLCQPVLGKRDGFAFFLHDLEHAHRFFHDPVLHDAQRTFFAGLAALHERGVFARYLEDAVFMKKFHYLISDMNTHPEHARQYLRAILIECHGRWMGGERLSPTAEGDIRTLLRRLN